MMVTHVAFETPVYVEYLKWLSAKDDFTDCRLHSFKSLNAKLNPIRHLLALAGAHHFVHVSRVRVNRYKDNLHLQFHFV